MARSPMELLEYGLSLIRGSIVEDDEAPHSEIEILEPGDAVEYHHEPGLDVVSAWAGTGSMSSPSAVASAVAFAKSIGLKRLDVIVNDHSKWRAARDFDTYPIDRITRLADAVVNAGIELHFMSWLMPHAKYIDQAADVLVPLVQRTQARSIVWDCEEPWTQAARPMNYAAAADLVRGAFGGIMQGVTGIGYASKAKLGPICAGADYLVPQAYSTSSSGLDPATVVPQFVARWRNTFPGKPVVAGLAAYRQTGIKGYTAESALRAAFGGAKADPQIRTAIYWSLAQIRDSSVATKTIRTLTGGG